MADLCEDVAGAIHREVCKQGGCQRPRWWAPWRTRINWGAVADAAVAEVDRQGMA